jgi:hypothetical protein
LDLVLHLVYLAAKLAHLILERINAGEELSDEVAVRRLTGWIGGGAAEIRPAARGRTPPALCLKLLQLVAKFQDLVLQRDPLTRLHLRVGARNNGRLKQQDQP